MYIVGSHTGQDWLDDVRHIPLWGDLHDAERHQRAKEMLGKRPEVEEVIGHSLGGAVAVQLQKYRPELKSKLMVHQY